MMVTLTRSSRAETAAEGWTASRSSSAATSAFASTPLGAASGVAPDSSPAALVTYPYWAAARTARDVPAGAAARASSNARGARGPPRGAPSTARAGGPPRVVARGGAPGGALGSTCVTWKAI